ncbi:MAG: FAD-dependent oxidoreductase [Verrucomicrobia bacterium]|nr:MAG: FAD-dependent oxidoreductase [Verrucomicrobiota bacterium]
MTAVEPNPTPFPFRRAETRAWLARSPAVSVLIIGGGINGAGVLRELAINGIDALLVDKADFTAGATCASSRMIHGGLRYLENGEFRLVREALRERNRLLRNAPHAVFPLETVIPVFRRFSGFGNAARKFLRLGGRPDRRGLWAIRVGLALYNRFARDSGMLPATPACCPRLRHAARAADPRTGRDICPAPEAEPGRPWFRLLLRRLESRPGAVVPRGHRRRTGNLSRMPSPELPRGGGRR